MTSETTNDGLNITHRIQERTLGKFLLFSIITLTFYGAYLAVRWAADVNHIIRRPKYNSAIVLVLGIVTLTIGFVVVVVIYAFDLERRGSAISLNGRLENLGVYVLTANILGIAIGLFSGGVAIILSLVISVIAFWLVQNELNKFARIAESEGKSAAA